MNLKFVSLPAFVVAALTLAASPAFARRHGGESHATHQSRSRGAVERAQPRAREPRIAQAPRVQRAPQYQQTPRIESRVAPRAVAPPRYYGGRVAVPRISPHYNSYYGPHYNSYYGHGTPWHGWYGYAPYQPYFFRPHLSLGIGVYVGYPVPYYVYPYPVPVYGYGAPPAEVHMSPNNSAYGGVSLQIGPNDAVEDAAVHVDGTYAGVVSDFDGTRQPLTLRQGTHHIEIDLNGYQPLAFDVTVQPGMVTPYEGELQRY